MEFPGCEQCIHVAALSFQREMYTLCDASWKEEHKKACMDSPPYSICIFSFIILLFDLSYIALHLYHKYHLDSWALESSKATPKGRERS